MTNTTHSTSCLEPTNCPDELTGMPCNSCWEDPEGHVEQGPRTPEDMVLDIRAHVDEAMADRQQRFQRGFQSTQLGRAVRIVMEHQLAKAGLR